MKKTPCVICGKSEVTPQSGPIVHKPIPGTRNAWGQMKWDALHAFECQRIYSKRKAEEFTNNV